MSKPNRTIKILYQKTDKIMFSENIACSVSPACHARYWTEAYTFDKEPEKEKTDLQICDDMFSLFNNDKNNPLSTNEMQKILEERNIDHTSMSVGDIVQIGKKRYICVNVGWHLMENKSYKKEAKNV